MKALVGLIAGIIFGSSLDVSILDTKILAVILLAALDSIFGGLFAQLEGKFNDVELLTGLAVNILFGVFLIGLGKILALELYYIALLIFGLRIFRNFAGIKGRLLKIYGN